MIRSRRAAVAVRLLAFVLSLGTCFAAEEPLEREMERVSKIAGGVVGAAAIHIESRRSGPRSGYRYLRQAPFFSGRQY